MELNENQKRLLEIFLSEAPKREGFNIYELTEASEFYSEDEVDDISDYLVNEGFVEKKREAERNITRFTDAGRELKEAGGIDEYKRKIRLNKSGNTLWKVLTGVFFITGSIAVIYALVQTNTANRISKESLDFQVREAKATQKVESLQADYNLLLSTLDSVLGKSAEKDSIILRMRK